MSDDTRREGEPDGDKPEDLPSAGTFQVPLSSPEEGNEPQNPFVFMIDPIHSLWCRSVCLLSFLQGFLIANAVTPPDTLGTAEVVSNRLLKGVRSPIPIQRLDTADIRLRGMTDIGDALRRLSGVNLRDYGGAGGLKTVSVRGLDASHTHVVYDGLSVSDVRQGQIDLQRFNLDNLSQIELQTLDADRLLVPVRHLGAATLYLTSLQASDTDRGFKGQFGLRQAAFNSWNPSLTLRYTTPRKIYFGLRSNYFFADNNYSFFVENGKASQWYKRTNSRMQTASGELNAGRRWASGEWNAKFTANLNDRHLPGPVILYVNENHEQLKEENAAFQVYYRQHKDRFEWFTAGKGNWERNHYSDLGGQYPGGRLDERYIQREAYLTAGLAYRLLSTFRLAYATDGIWNSLHSNQKTDNDVSRTAWFHSLSLQWRTERFSFTARGIAHLYANEHKEGKAARNAQRLTPSVSASCQLVSSPFQLYIRVGYKESFRMPTFTESYYRHYGSTELRPELARQLNAGLTLQTLFAPYRPNISLTCDFYHNKIKDHIINVPFNLFVWRTINLGEVKTTGIDLTLNGRWCPAPRHSLLLSTNYSWQRAKDCLPSNPQTYGNQLAYTPQHSGSGSFTWDNPWLSFVVHTTYSGVRWSTPEHTKNSRMPGYSEWGFAVFRSFDLGKVHLNARADLINAFNRHYEVIRRYPMPLRAYKLALTVSF